MAATTQQQIRAALALGRVVSGLLSAMASSILIYKIFARFRLQRRLGAAAAAVTRAKSKVTSYHRIMVGLSVMDILFSLGSAAAPVALPASAGHVAVLGVHGNTATCTTQGASSQLLGAVVLYTAALNTYFMLKIRYNVSDDVLRRRYEPWLHAVPMLFAIATTTAGMALQIFNPMPRRDLGCWIAAYPTGCSVQPETCTRGQQLYATPSSYAWYGFALGFVWLLAAFVVVLVNSVLIYTAIRHQERRNERYQVVAAAAASSLSPMATGVGRQCRPPFPQPNSSSGTIAVEPPTEASETHSSVSLDDHRAQCSGAERTSDCTDSSTDPKTPNSEVDVNSQNQCYHVPASLTVLDSDSTAPGHVASLSTRNSVVIDPSSRRVVATVPPPKVKTSRLAAQQSSLYCCATLVPFVVMCAPFVVSMIALPPPALELVFAFLIQYLVATQGLFNLMIYIRPPYKRLRESQREWSRIRCLSTCLFSSNPMYW